MILKTSELVWVYGLMMPPLYSCPARCKKCHHYATAVKVGDTDFVEGDFCARFDNEMYWEEQKMLWLEKNASKCPHFSKREKNAVYIGEIKPFVREAHWV